MTILQVADPPQADETRQRDRTLRGLTLLAASISIYAFVHFDHAGVVLAYKDSVSHMEIARRVIDSPTTGFGQLGGVWLPLPHLLMVPFIWLNPFYYSGLAGSIVSMASYVIASVLLYKITYSLTNKKTGGLVAALVFMANPNVLYMQSTPMTELLLFACMPGAVYGVQRWIQSDRYIYLVGAGIAAFLGTLARYEAWVLLAALALVVAFVSWRKGYDYNRTEGTLVGFLLIGALGIVSWLGWNLLIFGNALNFQDGEYAKPSLWVSSSDKAVGHLATAFRTYWYAITDNLGLGILVLAIIGVVLLIRQGYQALPALALTVFVPFFGLALYKGQRPLHVTQINGDLYNVRFGLLMVLPAAIFIGCLAGALWELHSGKLLVVGVACVGCAASVWVIQSHPSSISTLQEPLAFQRAAVDTQAQAAAFLRQNYHGGVIVMQFFGNESVLFDARINLVNNLYEGSYKQWLPALANPRQSQVLWIVMRHSAGSTDMVYHQLANSAQLETYRLVYQNSDYYIYEAV